MAIIQVQLDNNIKQEADDLFDTLGLDTQTAIKIFLKKSIEHQGIPFEVKKSFPNKESIEAMLEAKELCNDPNAKTYSSFSEVLKEVINN